MIGPALTKTNTRLEPLDFILAGVGAMTAVYSVGMSLSRPGISYLMMAIVALGTGFSYLVNRASRGQISPMLGGLAYLGAALAAFFAAPSLNAILPHEGFPRELFYAGVLAWMASFGSWVAWRDGSLLFQAIPSIALYGLVGAFSTLDGAEFLFFVFLLCCATLYARAHQRTMLQKAEESGFKSIGEIRQSAWRWMAGPEWALASAFVVVVLSLLGAPVIQQSVQQVAGVVRIVPPRVTPPTRSNIGTNADTSELRIGQGPRQLSERVVFKAGMDQPRYLKTGTLNYYTGDGWTRSTRDGRRAEAFESQERDIRRLISSDRYRNLEYRFVNVAGWMGTLPIPGVARRIQPQGSLDLNYDGTISAVSGIAPGAEYRALVSVLADDSLPTQSTEELPPFVWPYLEPGMTPGTVIELANEITRGITDPAEKAAAIKAEIERRATYNLNAAPTPRGADPVEHFLLGQQREGYCDLFASSMVLLARANGIPARVAVGYFPVSRQRDESGLWLVREADAHAWAELYFPGVGWVAYDPTEGAAQAQDGERGAPTQRPGLTEQPWYPAVRDGIIALVVLAGAAVLIVGYRRRQAFLRTPAELTRTAYLRYINALERISDRPKRLAETPKEYVRAVAENLNGTTAQAETLLRQFEIAFYAPEGPDWPADKLNEEVEAFERKLAAHAKERRRAHNPLDANPPARRV